MPGRRSPSDVAPSTVTNAVQLQGAGKRAIWRASRSPQTAQTGTAQKDLFPQDVASAKYGHHVEPKQAHNDLRLQKHTGCSRAQVATRDHRHDGEEGSPRASCAGKTTALSLHLLTCPRVRDKMIRPHVQVLCAAESATIRPFSKCTNVIPALTTEICGDVGDGFWKRRPHL